MVLGTGLARATASSSFVRNRAAPARLGKLKRCDALLLSRLGTVGWFRGECDGGAGMSVILGGSKRRKDYVYELLVVGAVTLAILALLPNAPWGNGYSSTDSSVFRLIGKQMADGLLPYRDTFDHKGPLIFVINWLGYLLDPKCGIWFFEFAAVSVSVWYARKAIRLAGNGEHLQFATIALVPLYLALYRYDFGNMTEEYALPGIAYSLYVFMLYRKYGDVTTRQALLVGMGLGSVLLLRPNLAALWFAYGIWYAVSAIRRKQMARYAKLLALVIVGAMAAMAPFIAWLASAGLLSWCFDCYIRFNLAYSGSKAARVLVTVLKFGMLPNVLFPALAIASRAWRSKGEPAGQWCPMMFALAVCFAAATFSGRAYHHYLIQLLPILSVGVSEIFARVDGLGIGSASKKVAGMLIVVLLGGQSAVGAIMENGYRETGEPTAAAYVETVDGFAHDILEVARPGDRLAVMGNYDILYFLTGMEPASRYSYTAPIAVVDARISDEWLQEVGSSSPVVLVAGDVDSFSEDERNMLERLEAIGYERTDLGDAHGTVYIMADHPQMAGHAYAGRDAA